MLLAIMTVRADALDQFRAYEKHAAKIMARHGGNIERTMVTPIADGLLKEAHLVRFSDADAFAAYRKDPELAQAAYLREQSVVETSILIGEEGPVY